MSPFMHGTTYYHFANPSEELAENFARMRRLGLNTVRVAEIWPGWEVLEPERGRYDWEKLDDYVDLAAQAGLRVVMGIGINNPPFWLFHEIQDLRCVDVSGRIATRRVQSANHDDPQYREHMERFVAAQVKRYADHDAVVAWQFGNEVRYGVDIPDNAATHDRFRWWLKEQYARDLDDLRQSWGVYYSDWDEIFPYRSRQGPPTEGLSPLAIATRRFLGWSLAQLIAWGASIVRRHSDKPVFHNSHGISHAPYSHWEIARTCDLVVQDIYPTMGGDDGAQGANTLGLDLAVSVARALRKPLWIGETGPAQYGTFRRNRINPALVEACVMEMLCCGAHGLLYFRHKAPKYEQPHKYTGSQSVFRRDGSPTIYVNTLENAAMLLERVGPRLEDARPATAQIGVYYPDDSLMFSLDAGYEDLQRDAIHGIGNLWNRAGLPMRWLDTGSLLTITPDEFPLVYVPLSYLFPEALGAKLEDYVKAGGTLVSECRPGYVDQNGWLYPDQPGAGLHHVFGAREDLFWETDAYTAWVKLLEPELQATFGRVCQSFRPDDGSPVAYNAAGEIIGVENRFGEGRAVLLGFAPSLVVPRGRDKYAAASNASAIVGQAELPDPVSGAVLLLSELARQTGIGRPVAWESDSLQLSCRYLDSDEGPMVFLANHGPLTTVNLPNGSRTLATNPGDALSFADSEGMVALPQYGWLLAES